MTTGEGQRRGRPREFDVDEAIEQAMLVFWRRGYEGATLSELTSAMRIGKPSFYAAFHDKKRLFQLALDRYTAGPGGYLASALAEPTARDVVSAVLNGAADATARTGSPHGCLTVQGALTQSDGSAPGFEILTEWRRGATELLGERFDRARTEGDLPSSTKPIDLARYVIALVFGIAVQAADGADASELRGVARTALSGWPHA